MPRQTITVTEFARLRGVTLQHIYNMLRAGRIPGARKIGRTWRIPAPEPQNAR